MARNREEPVKAVDSESESREDDDEVSSEEESDSETEQTQTQTAAPKKFQPPLPVKSQQTPPPPPPLPVKSQQTPPPPPRQSQPPSSTEEEESGSETESDSDGADSNARPLASKPMEEAQKPINGARRTRSKANAPEPVTPANPSAAKRPSEDTAASKDGKKSKKSAGPASSEKKPNLFQRVWSEEDEILLLKGMIEYSSKNKCDDIDMDMDGFYDFIKKSVHMDFSMTQLKNKIRRMKKKYKNNKSREKKGKERSFAKLHEQSIYQLSKEIWGKENRGDCEKVVGSPKAEADVKKEVVGSGEGDGLFEERMLRNGREIYEVEQGLEGEEEWKKLSVEELELYLKQLELRIAQTKLVLNAIKGGHH